MTDPVPAKVADAVRRQRQAQHRFTSRSGRLHPRWLGGVAGEFVSRRLVDRQLVADLIEQGPTLDRLQQAVVRRLPSAGLLDEIATRWTAIESELEAVWSERWRELAPGSDVLTYVWQSYGRVYNKLHDGLAIAQAMQPPKELADVLRGFLTA